MAIEITRKELTAAERRAAAGKVKDNAIRPGLIDTEMQRASGEADRLTRLMATVPMGRAGRAQEVAEAAIWLLSDAASYVTGAILPVTGGRKCGSQAVVNISLNPHHLYPQCHYRGNHRIRRTHVRDDPAHLIQWTDQRR